MNLAFRSVNLGVQRGCIIEKKALKKIGSLGTVAHTYNLCTQEAKARGFCKSKASLGLNSKPNKFKKK